jgi:hypothetical protein
MLTHFRRWALPWVLPLVVSSAIAYAAEQGLGGALSATGSEESATTSVVPSTELNAHMEVGFQWVILSPVDNGGTARRFACLARADMFAADSIQLSVQELDHTMSQLACHALS